MKMMMMFLTFIMAGGYVFAQSNNSENPYRNQSEVFVQTGREMYEEFIAPPCIEEHVNDEITSYLGSDDDRFKEHKLMSIVRMNCKIAVSFLKDLLLSEPSEDIRCNVLLYLGWHRPYDLLPFLSEYAKKDISPEEKITVASVFAVMEKFQQAVEILDRCCFELEEMNQQCITSYYMTGYNTSSIKYFSHYLNDEYYKLSAAIFLARLGVYDVTFPVFAETVMKNQTVNNDYFGDDHVSRINVAIKGLAMIGTEEALVLIKEQCKNEHPRISNLSKGIIRNLEGGTQ